MKRLLVAAIALATGFMASAQNVVSYYEGLPFELPVPALPVIPEYTVCLSEFGGVPDGVTLNTEAFANAIAALDKKGGGHLVVPSGVWLTGPIVFKSRIDLHLEKGALVLMSPDKAQFVRKDGKILPGISASKRTDISITGEGIIDGNGEWWRAVKRSKVSDVEWNDYRRMGGTVSEDGSLWYPFGLKSLGDIAPSPQEQERLRVHMVRFTDCERVLVSGVTLQNSPKFHLVPQRCKNVVILGVTVRCPWNAQNGDGIDLMHSSDVLVADCTVDVGDDGICLKAGGGPKAAAQGATERILVRGNTVFHAHGGFVIGSEFSAGINDVVVLGNTFSGTDTGLRFKSAPGRGGKTSRIRIKDIWMSDIRDQAIVFQTSYINAAVGENNKMEQTEQFLPEFCDISIQDVTCRDARIGLSAQGTPAMIHDIRFSSCTLFCTEKTVDDPSGLLDLSGLHLLCW